MPEQSLREATSIEIDLHGRASGPPAGLVTLIERFDPAMIDVPSGSARIRLAVDEEGQWDAAIDEWADAYGGDGEEEAQSLRRGTWSSKARA